MKRKMRAGILVFGAAVMLGTMSQTNGNTVFAEERNAKKVEVLQEVFPEIKVNFVADGDISGYLYGVDDRMEYSVDNEVHWNQIRQDGQRISGILKDYTMLSIRYRNKPNLPKWTMLFVRQALYKGYQYDIKVEDGYLSNIPEGYEVKKEKAGMWQQPDGGRFPIEIKSEIENYQFRRKAEGSILASSDYFFVSVINGRLLGDNSSQAPEAENKNPEMQGQEEGQKNPEMQGQGDGEKKQELPKAGEEHKNPQDGEKGKESEKSQEKPDNGMIGGGNSLGGSFGFGGGAVSGSSDNEKTVAEEEKIQEEKKTESNSDETVLEGVLSDNKKEAIVKIEVKRLSGQGSREFHVITGENKAYSIKMNTSDITEGKEVKVFEEKNGKFILVNELTYRAEKGELSFRLPLGKKYVLVEKKKAEKIEKKINLALVLRERKFVVNKGAKKISFAKKFDKRNCKSIKYSYDKAKAVVKKNGAVSLRKNVKSAIITVKVVLKNNVKKNLKLKVVRK